MIQMLNDFRGRASGEIYYQAGQIVSAGREFEQAMVAEGVAEFVVESRESPIDEESPKKKASRK